MKSLSFSSALHNCLKNICFLFSSIAALCLFVSPSLISIMLTAMVFVAVVIVAACNVVKPAVKLLRNQQVITLLLSVLICCLGFYMFNTSWALSSMVAAVAGIIGLGASSFLFLSGVAGAVVGFYAIFVLSRWMVFWAVKLMKEHLPVQQKEEILANLKRNWFFPVSGFLFFFLSATLTLGSAIAFAIASLIALLVASQFSSIWSYTNNHSLMLRILSIVTAVGICLGNHDSMFTTWSDSSRVLFAPWLPASFIAPGMITVLLALASVYFVYFCLLVFWGRMTKVLSESGVFREISHIEWILYAFLMIASICFMVFSFSQSQAFYGTELSYDIIYTSDSPDLVKGNVYLALTYIENDLRQPLFALFSAPFTGIPYLIARLFGASATVRAILLNSVQVVMLFAANLMLTRMMKLDSVKRICFLLLTFCTYTQLLFTLMMEQYIVAYFWLIFCMYLIAEKQQPDRIALWGAGGTLLTSLILLPFLSDKSPVKDFKAWFMDMVKYGLEFVGLMLVFCRFDVFFNFVSSASQLSGYTGNAITLFDKICQYTAFLASCFVAPNAGVTATAYEHISWQLDPATGIHFVGVLILVLALASALWNRDKKSSLLAAGWVGFSVVMLFILGWGTQENGLILYALYFGWAFSALLFQLVEKIESRLKIRFLVPACTVCAVIALLMVNIPAIMELIHFAIAHYPV